MPVIKLLPKKAKNYERPQTKMRKLRQKAYNSTAWKKLRITYMKEHPMCEECGKRAAEDIHHIKSFIVDEKIDWNLLLNEDNLMALCKRCHGLHHSGKKIISSKTLSQEDEDKQLDFNITII